MGGRKIKEIESSSRGGIYDVSFGYNGVIFNGQRMLNRYYIFIPTKCLSIGEVICDWRILA